MTTPSDDLAARLNDAQARQAVKLLYEQLPAEQWEDGRKPNAARVDTVVRSLQDQADGAASTLLASLLDDAHPEAAQANAALARIVLAQALATPDLAPLARRAIDEATQPNMGIDVGTAVFIIGMLLATSRIDRDADGSWHVHLAGGAPNILRALKVPDLLEKLPAVISALPAAVVARFFKA